MAFLFVRIGCLVARGSIVADLHMSFPAEHIFDEGNFVSLLYYYGMLTIVGTRGDMLRLGIPNNNVRKQYYEYLLAEYKRMGNIDFSPLNPKMSLETDPCFF